MSNPFWDYSIAVYSRQGVAPACLALQDSFDLDVNLLLYAAWLAHLGQRLDQDHLSAVEALVADWRDNMVRPLRRVRQHWRESPQAVELREGIKSLELRAEQQQQDAMYGFHQGAAALSDSPQSLRENLVLVAALSGEKSATKAAAIERLAKAFTE